jgi:hypothetical protein
MLVIDLDVARRVALPAVPVDRDAAAAGRVQVEAVAVDSVGSERGGGCAGEPRAGGPDDWPLRPGPVLPASTRPRVSRGSPASCRSGPRPSRPSAPGRWRRMASPSAAPRRRHVPLPPSSAAPRRKGVRLVDGVRALATPAAHSARRRTARPLAGHPVGLAPVTGVGAGDPRAVPALVADQVAGQHPHWRDCTACSRGSMAGGPGQRSQAVRPGLHGPPGGAVRSPVAAIRARAAFFAERSEVMASSTHGAANPRFLGRSDRHDHARERCESVTLVLVTSQSAWAAAARRRAGATASAPS